MCDGRRSSRREAGKEQKRRRRRIGRNEREIESYGKRKKI